MTFLARVADLVLNQPLLLTPDKAEVIAGVLSGRIGIDGPDLSRFEGSPVVMDEQGRLRERPYMVADGGVAIITITGSLVNRGAWIGANSGLTSYEGIQHQLKVAKSASEVRSVILDIHSPGGEAVGCFETAAAVRDLARSKKVVAVVNGIACSGGYAIASGATEVVTTESGVSGSIGVISLHVDASKKLEADGLKPTLIIAGSHKADGHPFGPLPDDVREEFQARVDSIYRAFLNCVAAGRGERMTVAMAQATEARVFIGAAAQATGLADRVGTFESVLADLTRAPGRSTSSMKGKSMTEPNGGPAAETTAGTFTQAQMDAAIASARAEGQTASAAALAEERARIAGLDGLLAKLGGHAAALTIIAAAKADGSSVEATAFKLIDSGATLKAAVLGALEQDDASARGAAPAVPGSGGAKKAVSRDELIAEWQGSDKLQAEFITGESYAAATLHDRKKGIAK